MLAVEQLDCRMSVCLHDAVTLKSLLVFYFSSLFFFFSFFFFLFGNFLPTTYHHAMLIFITDDIIRFEFHAMDNPIVFCILQYLLLKILISFNFTSEAILLYHLVPGSRLFDRSLRKLRIFLIVNFTHQVHIPF